MDLRRRNNVRIFGRGQQPMMFSHGYGCDQTMWRLITPSFSPIGKLEFRMSCNRASVGATWNRPSSVAFRSAHRMLQGRVRRAYL